MSADAAADLCRVTVVGTRGRFDVAIPASMPLAYLLPTLLRQANDIGRSASSPAEDALAESGVSHGGWVLQRLGGWPFDTGQSAAELGIADGEVLYLRPRRDELPPPVFDDVVEAIGWSLAERTTRWNAGASRAAGLAAAGVLLGLAAGLILLAGPPWRLAAGAAGLGALLLTLGATAVSRAVGNAPAAALLGCAAIPYAFVAGLVATIGSDPLRQAGGPALLTGASTALVTLVLVAAGVGGAEPAFLGAGLVTAVLFGAGLLAGPAHLSPAGVAAAAIGLVFLIGPFMPGAAYRLARLPAPNLPSSADEVRGRAATLPGAQLSERSLAADRYLTALLAGASLVIAGGTPFLVAAPGWAPSTVAGAAGVLSLLRMRLFTGRAQRIWLLSAALAAATSAVAVAATRTPDGGARSVLAVGVLLLGLVVAGFAVRSPRAASPWRGRLLDVTEIAVAIATIPLVLSVLGVYGYVRSLTG